MGRASRKNASSAETREHWTDTHPDRHLWSPGRLAVARTQTQEEYEALYGRGAEADSGPDFSAIAEKDFAFQYRNGEIDPADGVVYRLVQKRQEGMTWPLPGDSPLEGDLGEEYLRRLQNENVPLDAVSVLGAALARPENMEIFWKSLLRSRKEYLQQSPWERAWSGDDTYLFEKVLPALYSSPETERLLADDEESEAWIESVLTSQRVQEKFGSVEDHGKALQAELEKRHPALAGRLQERTRAWHLELGLHAGQRNGDQGYVDFIELGMQVEQGSAATLEDAAIEASRTALIHLMEKQLVLAMLETNGNDLAVATRYHDHGGDTLNILHDSGYSAEEIIAKLGLFEPRQITELQALVQARKLDNQEIYTNLGYHSQEEALRETLAEGIEAGCAEHIDKFTGRQAAGALPTIGPLLFESIRKAFS